jgi:fumarate reductase flavoprotein subunit
MNMHFLSVVFHHWRRGKMNNDITRRGFIKGAAVATGAGILAGCSPKVVETDAPTTVPATATPEVVSTPVASGEAKVGSATVRGHGGDITVNLTVKDGKIVDCKIVGDGETPGIGGKAVEQMPAQYIQAGTLEVDGVAGATVSSTAIKSAAQMAYNQATGVTAGAIKMKPGQYTAGAVGYWEIWELPVTITVSETALLKIEVPDDRFKHGETEVILQSVKDKLFPRIIENQSVTIDAVAGATVSSDAVKLSVENALKQALKAGGSDETAIQHFYKTPAKKDAGVTEEKNVDIVVIGLGSGSIFAMMSAMETIQSMNGGKLVSILGLEKAGKFGGKSALTHEANAINPPNYVKMFNKGKPYVDAAAYEKAWLKFTTAKDGTQRAKPEMIKLYMQESGKTIDWMYNQCYRFGTMQPSSMFNGCVAFNASFTSNKDVGTYEDRRKWVNYYYNKILSTVVAQGGEYLLETEAYEYIMEGDRVAGVKARNTVTGKEYIIHAKAIIQGTGGFSANDEMMSTLINPKYAGPRKLVGMHQDDGKMMKAAMSIGAGTWNIDMSPIMMHIGLDHYLKHFPINYKENTLNGRTGRQYTWTLNDIPLGMGISADALDVTKKGERFDDESIVLRFATDTQMESWCAFAAGQYYYSIWSTDQVDALAKNGFTNIPRWEGYVSQGGVPDKLPMPEIYECLDATVKDGMAWKADTIEDLAKQIDMDPATLANTVKAYNGFCDKGVDEQYGKDPKFLAKVGKGPYYAIKLMNTTFGTAGGLDVDTQIRVLKPDHITPIPGLYAIGLDSLGVLLNNERNYVGFGGVAQGWYTTSGRLAGKYAAQYVKDTFGLAEVSPALVQTAAHSA